MSFSQSMSKNEVGLFVIEGIDMDFFIIVWYAKY